MRSANKIEFWRAAYGKCEYQMFPIGKWAHRIAYVQRGNKIKQKIFFTSIRIVGVGAMDLYANEEWNMNEVGLRFFFDVDDFRINYSTLYQ